MPCSRGGIPLPENESRKRGAERPIDAKRWLLPLAMAVFSLFAVVVPARAKLPSESEIYTDWQTVSVQQLKDLVERVPPIPDEELINLPFRLAGTVRVTGKPSLSSQAHYYIQGEDDSTFPVKCTDERPSHGDELFLMATLQKDPNDGWYLQEAHAWIFRSPDEIKALGLDEPSSEDYHQWKNVGGYDFAVENAFRRGFVGLPVLTIGDWVDGRRTTIEEIQKLCRGLHSNPPEPARLVPCCRPEPTEPEKYSTWNTISVGQLKALTEQGLPDDRLINQRFRLIGTVRIVDMPVLPLESYYFIQGEDNAIFAVQCRGAKPMHADEEFLTATLQKDPNDGWYLQEAHAWIFRSPDEIKALGLDEPSSEDYHQWKNVGGYDFAVENAFRRGFVGLPVLTIGDWVDGRRTTIEEIQNLCQGNPC